LEPPALLLVLGGQLAAHFLDDSRSQLEELGQQAGLDRLLGHETLRRIGRAIEKLPPLQAEVIRLRDVLGWSSDEVRNALDLSEVNQRVLLHRARTRVRRELDAYLRTGSEDA